jgi:hypothetical protein
MSRPSTASLSVVPVVAVSRLAPADGLAPEEAALWAAVVDSKPAEWFGLDSAPLLKEYVRACHMCDLIDAQVKAALAGGEPGEVKGFLDMRDKEAKRVASLATKLRLTQQSRYTPQAAATADKKAGNARPWQFGKS